MKTTFLAGIVSLALCTSGCQTTGESAGLGAAIGAGVGAIIGSQSGDALEGAAIGAAIGAATGAVVHDVRKTQAEKTKTAEQTAETYNYTSAQGESMVLENAEVDPAVVDRGDWMDASLQYALLGSGDGLSVTEARLITRDDKVIAQVSSEVFQRNDGVWVSSQSFRIPEDWEPGAYTVEQSAETKSSRVFSVTHFSVR